MPFLRSRTVRIQYDVVLARAGRAVSIEAPEAFNHAVREFLEGI